MNEEITLGQKVDLIQEVSKLRNRIKELEKEIKEKDAMILRMEIALRMDAGKE